MQKFITAIMFCAAVAFAGDACDEPHDNVEPRFLEGSAEVVVGVESPEFVGKLLGCFSALDQESSTIIEYRDDTPVDAVMIQTVEVCFATHAHVSVGTCVRDAMLEAGGQVP